MAKKFVRGVTGIEDIESYDKTLTNVNDILSDGEDTFVHTKKGKTESYYKLTDSVKTINSTGSTITVSKDENGNVNLNTNPQKVLEHTNLRTGDGLQVTRDGNTSLVSISPTTKTAGTNLNNVSNGIIYGSSFGNSPGGDGSPANYITLQCGNGDTKIQLYTRQSITNKESVVLKYRFITPTSQTQWRDMTVDSETVTTLLAQKQNTLSSNTSIGVLSNNQLQQLFSQKQTYTHVNGLLKTHVKNVSENTTLTNSLEEFNFTVKINQNATNIVVTLNAHDTTAFNKIMTKYGSNNTVRISGCVFTLSGSSLTVSTTNNTAQNYVITFSDILD